MHFYCQYIYPVKEYILEYLVKLTEIHSLLTYDKIKYLLPKEQHKQNPPLLDNICG